MMDITTITKYFRMNPQGTIHTEKRPEQIFNNLNDVICRDDFFIKPINKNAWKYLFYQKSGQVNDFHNLIPSWKACGFYRNRLMPVYDLNICSCEEGGSDIRYDIHPLPIAKAFTIIFSIITFLFGVMACIISVTTSDLVIFLFGLVWILTAIFAYSFYFWYPYKRSFRKLEEVISKLEGGNQSE